MALEDALVLAHCLDKERSNPESALRLYQSIGLKRANRVVKNSWWMGKMFQLENPFLGYLRNGFLSMRGEKRNIEQMKWLFDEQFELA